MNSTRILKDCFAVEYRQVDIVSNGTCGYAAVSYCLTGSTQGYESVIQDALNAFDLNELLFVEQIEMANEMNLDDYKQVMRLALQNVHAGENLPESLWLDSGYLIAYSLMYDVAFFVYNTRLQCWSGYNVEASNGYCCLVYNGWHFDALIGSNSTMQPPIPKAVLKAGPSRQDCNWNYVHVDLQKYSFCRVWKWPGGQPQVNVINALTSQNEPIVRVQSNNHAGPKTIVEVDETPSTSCLQAESSSKTCVVECENPLLPAQKKSLLKQNISQTLSCSICGFGPTKKPSALRMHMTRVHVNASKTAQNIVLVTDNNRDTDLRINIDCSEATVDGVELMCDVERESVNESFDSDSSVTSLRSTRSNSKLSPANSVIFKTPLPQSKKAKCCACGKTFKDLTKHVVCRPTPTKTSMKAKLDSSDESMSETTVPHVRKRKTKGEKQQFEQCSRSDNVPNHNRDCNYDAEGKMSESERDENLSVCSHNSEDVENSSIASSVSSGSSARSIRYHKRACMKESVSNDQNHIISKESVTMNDCSERMENILPDIEFSAPSNCSENKSMSYCKQKKVRGIKLFTCLVCNKSFRKKQLFELHFSNMHEKPETRPVADSINDKVTTFEDKRPLKDKHGGTTQKAHVARDLEVELENLKQKYLPKESPKQVDPLYDALKKYQQTLANSITNVTTERLTDEILRVVERPELIGDDREYSWTQEDRERLDVLNAESKNLQRRQDWYWDPTPGSAQAIYNEKRLEFCMDNELTQKLVYCEQCKTTSLMVGLEQINSRTCYDCLLLKDKVPSYVKELRQAWDEVRPSSDTYPKNTESGHTDEDLPYLYPGDKSVLALIFPVVTVRKTYFRNKQLRQESISLLGQPEKTWVQVLPRTSLKERFFVLERIGKDSQTKYIVANRKRVEVWLRYLFKNHKEYKRRLETGELEISEDALKCLESQCELASVDSTLGEDELSPDSAVEHGIVHPELESGFDQHHVLALDQFPNLYLKKDDVLKIRKEGKIEIVKDESEVRKPTYHSPANLAFPTLLYEGQKSPVDFENYKLGRDLLKKLVMFTHKMASGDRQWTYAEDDIFLMHQYARLVEMRIHAHIGYYLSQHPSVAHLPLESVVKAFKDGYDEAGLLDAKLPDLTMLLTRVQNSRHYWFQERQALETISRDLSDANLFMTINPEPRHSPDVRALIHSLHFPGKPIDPDWNFASTEEFTELMSRYSPHVCVYLWRKTRIFLRAFLNDICRIPETEDCADWTSSDQSENSFFWFRTEFTSTRGFPHFHCMIRLPNTLNLSVLSRVVHNMRVVRDELKKGNIKSSMREEAFEMIRFGLLASRYLVMFADSVSSASFYTERVESFDVVDPSKEIDIDALRAEFEKHCKAGTHTAKTHPLMRKHNDPRGPKNPYVDFAEVVAATCVHGCITNRCGGDVKTGNGCRFNYPKKKMSCTVPAVMQVNSEQCELQILLRRTNTRVCNVNWYISRYLRCNNDLQVTPDASMWMRYCAKYCTKSGNHDVLMNEVIEHINSRSTDLLQPAIRQVLSHLFLADCSHRAFLSKHQLCWHIMGLPMVSKTFQQVRTVAFYPRASIYKSFDDQRVIELSDRTEYSAYSERCRNSTVIKPPRNRSTAEDKQGFKAEIANMSLREFSERVSYKWKSNKEVQAESIDPQCTRKFRTRDVNSGYWELSFYQKRQHIRPSIRLHTKLAIEYEPIDADECTSQTSFFDIPRDKRQQLLRAYMELVFYSPWSVSPDVSFLSEEHRNALNDDPERESRYSLRRLQAFFEVYKKKWAESLGPHARQSVDTQTRIRNQQWFRDNQYAYSMFLANEHNNDIRLDRASNKGVLSATYDEADELQGTEVSVRPALYDENDDVEYPSVLNFCMPNDGLREIMHQPAPELDNISVTFPLQHAWQTLEDMIRKDKTKMFIAKPPVPNLTVDDLTVMQKFAYDCMLDDKMKVLYLCGKAGSGKSTVAMMACMKLKGRVQCAAGTGRAAAIFNAPTVHSAFQWSLRRSNGHSANKIGQMQTFYESVDVFVIDEINALSAECLAMMHDTMSLVFNPQNKKTAEGDPLPFGGKRMVFLGDIAQLRPVLGAAIYDERVHMTPLKKRGAMRQVEVNLKGQMLYRKYLLPNDIILKQGQRNAGLLQVICDRLRDGNQTSDDLSKLTFLRRKFPEASADYGIHYDNDACNEHNLRQLWKDCKSENPSKRLYICKATYEDTGSNQSIIDGLACLPAKVYGYAPNMLCLSEMCLVRITRNINVGSGLVNGATGRVVQILYDNADVQSLLEGKHPPPHCIVVEFDGFQGLVLDANKPDDKFFPIERHSTRVPIYRDKIFPDSKDIPEWIRKRQKPSLCYRQQFPLDLAMHMTAHRSQGQTMRDCVVSVDMNLDNPDNAIPNDIGSVIYVGLTRVNKLKDLLVSPIFPDTWEKIGKSEMDDRRRKADADLIKAAGKFAMLNGKYPEYENEMEFEPDYGDLDREWDEIKNMSAPPERKPAPCVLSRQDALETKFKIKVSGEISHHSLCLTPVMSERHVGIDQGRRNFAIVCVDKIGNSPPKLVAAELYDLNLPVRFGMLELAHSLIERTDLFDWMQLNETHWLKPVNPVVVHLEQMSVKNANSRELTIGLGKYLQSRAVDLNRCVVKLSQANVHRKNGPMFKMGDEIVKSLALTPSCATSKRAGLARKRSVHKSDVSMANQVCVCRGPISRKCRAKKHLRIDVQIRHETSESNDLQTNGGVTDFDVDESDVDNNLSPDCNEYRRKKKMSASIFHYFVNATEEQQVELGIDIEASVQDAWKAKLNCGTKPKLDDVGDGLLHALNELLCGSSNFRQLVPASSSVSNNRSVVIAVLPHATYWIAVNCQFNMFVLEDMGVYRSNLEGTFFRSDEVVKRVISKLSKSLRTALTDFGGDGVFEPVDDIKIVVKQLQGLKKFDLTRKQAGSLTHTAYTAMKTLTDSCCPSDSKGVDKKDKLGHTYIQTNAVSGCKFQVLKSSGKHLNAVMSFLEWFKDNAARVIDKRDADLNQSEKLLFFETLVRLAACEESRLEMMKLSDVVKAKLSSNVFSSQETKKLLADLILISINKNQGHVKAIAANYRQGFIAAKKKDVKRSKTKKKPKQDEVEVDIVDEQQDEVEPTEEQYSDVEPD